MLDSPTDDLGTYAGFTLSGYFRGLRQNARAWDYSLTAWSPDGAPFEVRAFAYVCDGCDLLRAHQATSIEAVLAARAKGRAVRLIERGEWGELEVYEVHVEP